MNTSPLADSPAPLLTTLVLLALLAANLWMLFFHKQKMGSESSDQPQDPLFTRFNRNAGFLAISAVLAATTFRGICIAYGRWDSMPGLFHFSESMSVPVTYGVLLCGTAVATLGFALRFWAVKTLGRLFTFEIGIREGHKVVDQGPYHWIRHPSYTGFLLLGSGAAIAAGSILGAVGLAIGNLIFFSMRMHHEEEMLQKHFGDAYRDYMKRTKRLMPYLY